MEIASLSSFQKEALVSWYLLHLKLVQFMVSCQVQSRMWGQERMGGTSHLNFEWDNEMEY